MQPHTLDMLVAQFADRSQEERAAGAQLVLGTVAMHQPEDLDPLAAATKVPSALVAVIRRFANTP